MKPFGGHPAPRPTPLPFRIRDRDDDFAARARENRDVPKEIEEQVVGAEPLDCDGCDWCDPRDIEWDEFLECTVQGPLTHRPIEGAFASAYVKAR